ncbi:hypothetical protein JJQ72_11570 [Paenibacillus sp. F411]|nr:hypothetical protein [Paenibacillus sp. F411]
MTSAHLPSSEGEVLLSRHPSRFWQWRERELAAWASLSKPKKGKKRLALFGGVHVDAEMLPVLEQFRAIHVQTEFSCAGVSLADEPEEHSLYAYITVRDSEPARRLVAYLMNSMRHRLLVTYEPERGRYDLSSWMIGHNRSFCYLLEQYTKRFRIENDKRS